MPRWPDAAAVHGGASSQLDRLDELFLDIRFPYPTANAAEIGRLGHSAGDFAETLTSTLRPGDTFGDTPQCVHLKVGFSSDTHAHCAAFFSVAGSVSHANCHTRAYFHQDTGSFTFSDSYIYHSTPDACGHSDAFSHSHGNAGGNRNAHSHANTHAHRGRRFGFASDRRGSHAGGHSQLRAYAYAYAYTYANANVGTLRREVRGGVLHSRLTSDNQYFLEKLGVSWYLDFQSDMSQVPNGANKVAYISVPTDSTVWTSGDAENIEGLSDSEVATLGFLTRAQIREMAQDSPGTYWYLFGEPNRYGYITGPRFASVFHYFITELTGADPTAKIVSPSLLNWDWTCYQLCYYEPGKNWIAGFISAYESRYGAKPDVDAWAIDTYPIDWVRTPNAGVPHAQIAIDQITGLRDYLATIPEYAGTPIWITEISLHVGYDGWAQDPPGSGNFVPVGVYHWGGLSDYIIRVLDWLEANSSSKNIERWFFFITWKDIVNVGSDGYMGITFFNDPGQRASLNCLGETYRHRALGLNPVRCDATGATVPAN